MKRILVIVLAVATAVAALGAGTLWWNSRALGTPVAVEFADAPVSDRLASATVLALGEATHGTHEFQAARLTLLQKVVDRGFTTIAWEEDFGSIARVNAWLQGGPGTAQDAVAQFGYRLNKTTANRDLLVWIRAYDLLFENLRWVVERGAATGREHRLLFAHNGHVDRAGQASLAPGDKLGELAARHWGESYRAIGTDGHRVAVEADGMTAVTVSGRHRGLSAGTRVGYLEVADVTGPDADLLRSRVTMVSVGYPFAAWQAWIPFLHTVDVTPTEAWDALIYVSDAAPTTRVP